jgi:hypothetical protein
VITRGTDSLDIIAWKRESRFVYHGLLNILSLPPGEISCYGRQAILTQFDSTAGWLDKLS